MKRLALGLIYCAINNVAHAAASTITIECPDKFPSEAIKFSAVPPGWTPTAPNSLEIGNAQVIYGPPSSHAYSAPTTYREGKRRDVGTWGMSSSAPGGNWLQCAYGARGELRLSQQLPASTSACVITKHKDADGNLTKVDAACTLTP